MFGTKKSLPEEQHLVQNARDYAESIIATLREPFVVLNKDLLIKTANRSFYQTFNVSPKETENQSIYDLGNGQWNIPKLRTLLMEVTSNDHPIHDYEVEHDFPTIGRKIMLLNAQKVYRLDNHSDLILLAIEDITKRRQAEAALEISEVRYRRLFEAAKDGILILDVNNGTITDANPFMSELLGYTYDEFIGKELWELGMFKDVGASRAAFRELQERGYIRYDHLPLKTTSGNQVEIEMVSNVYREDHDKVVQCNVRDVTERTRLERQTEEQAQALADLSRRKDEFIAMLSHELRNPLAPILSAVHLLRHVGDDNPLRQQARAIIERQAGQLARLIDDLMEVSRITTGTIKLHHERLDARSIAERAVESVRPLIDQSQHELSVSLSPEPIWVHADAARLEQVMVNLLNNAAKYMDKGGHIWLNVQQEGDEAVLRVRDTGVGIAADLLPRIFDLFTQSARTMDRSQGGLGIGLTVVQRLVEMHRGTVEASSAGFGEGSEFIVRLPVLLSPAGQDYSPAIVTVSRSAETWRVLVVDDNADSADISALLMRALGHEVRVAYSGPTALETAVEFRPDFVLLDIGLPDMDGYEVARRLRRHPQLRDVWLIAMTGYGQDNDRRRSQEAGFDHHMVKPVDPDKLEELLACLIRHGRPAIEASESDLAPCAEAAVQ